MRQSRTISLVEAGANVLVGFGLAVVTQIVVFPWFGLSARLNDALGLGGIFTIVSLARGYLLRRLFEGSTAPTKNDNGPDTPRDRRFG